MKKTNTNKSKTAKENVSPFFEHNNTEYYFANMDRAQRRLVFLEAMKSFFEDDW